MHCSSHSVELMLAAPMTLYCFGTLQDYLSALAKVVSPNPASITNFRRMVHTLNPFIRCLCTFSSIGSFVFCRIT